MNEEHLANALLKFIKIGAKIRLENGCFVITSHEFTLEQLEVIDYFLQVK